MTSDERELIEGFQAGDRAAFDLLYERYGNRVLGFAMRLTGNRADAEDLVQEAFVSAYTGRATFEGRSGILGWLLAIAARRWRDRNRRQVLPTTELEEETDLPSAAQSGLEDQAISAMTLADALSRLEPEYREALLLVASQGMTYQEAAQAIGEPVGTVKWRVHKAARIVRGILSAGEGGCDELQPAKRRANPGPALG